MRILSFFICFAALVLAADAPPAGTYTGEWKSDSSGNGGAIRMTLDGAGKCQVMFTLAGTDVPTKTQSVKYDGVQLTVAYDFEVQNTVLRSTITGKWDGTAFTGTYRTTMVDSGDQADAGTWKATRGK